MPKHREQLRNTENKHEMTENKFNFMCLWYAMQKCGLQYTTLRMLTGSVSSKHWGQNFFRPRYHFLPPMCYPNAISVV